MMITSEKKVGKDRETIIKDYYEKFEKQSGKPFKLRKKSIESLQYDLDNIVCELFDSNYESTKDYFMNNRKIQTIIRLKNGEYLLAYAIVYIEKRGINNIYKLSDIIIRGEDHIHKLANGEINIQKNIYYLIVDYLENYLSKINEEEYLVVFEMIDSPDLFEILSNKGYRIDNNVDINDALKHGALKMVKNYSLEREDDELHLTRK